MSSLTRVAYAGLAVLGVLQIVMLGSLYAAVPPHPPEAIALFGIAPFLAVSLSAIAAAATLGPLQTSAGRGVTVFAALCALLSFGPQKYFDPQFPLIWPAVLAAQIAAVVIFYAVIRGALQGTSGQKVQS